MQEFWTRFKRDLTANWKKTAALGVLFLFGCCFWIPMLARAVGSRRVAAAVSPPLLPSANSETAPTISEPNSIGVAGGETFWSNLSRSLADDPLFHPAEMSSVTRDPFVTDESHSPLPVLFAEDRKAETSVKSVAVKAAAPTGLELRSTMIGRTRRVAIINGQLYQVGREVLANGHSFRLASIESHRVVLTSGDKDFELKLARPKLADVLDRDRAVDLSTPPTP